MNSLIDLSNTLFHSFSQCPYFIPPEIIKVTFGFLMFSGSIKQEHLQETRQDFYLISVQCSSFIPPFKRQKTLGLLLFQRGIKSKHWEEVDEIISYLS